MLFPMKVYYKGKFIEQVSVEADDDYDAVRAVAELVDKSIDIVEDNDGKAI